MTLASETPAAAVEMTEVGPGPSDPVVYRGLPKRPTTQEHPYKSIHIYSEIDWTTVQINDGLCSKGILKITIRIIRFIMHWLYYVVNISFNIHRGNTTRL